ncbi:MAG: hypothetical protein EAZ53_02625 [Bacteroidetes bacterium]|nr:MAG: hypothetical protein EAZ53_02625 [Bacteroidota bacterium]
MAYPNLKLIESLRKTATNLRNGAFYAWGNQGACNCGNLVQVVTNLTPKEIVQYVQQTSLGEWTEMAEEFCPITNAPINLLVAKLEALGLTTTDIHHLEYLNDTKVLKNLPGGFRYLNRNEREHAILYFETFAQMLENELLKNINIENVLADNLEFVS